IVEQEVELRRRELAVLLPPDRLLGVLVAHHELVLGRTAGMDAGLGAQRAALDQVRLAVANGVLVERGLRQIPMDRGGIIEAELGSGVSAVPETGFLHGIDLQKRVQPQRWTPSIAPLWGRATSAIVTPGRQAREL